MSIIGVAWADGGKCNYRKFLGICKAWVYTFPICGIISYVLAYIIGVVFA
ncbi:MAG: hypothetical protein IKD76_01375 [Clostridia bacterium]|nr:hypothetical protein [Clostridia bacterium]